MSTLIISFVSFLKDNYFLYAFRSEYLCNTFKSRIFLKLFPLNNLKLDISLFLYKILSEYKFCKTFVYLISCFVLSIIINHLVLLKLSNLHLRKTSFHSAYLIYTSSHILCISSPSRFDTVCVSLMNDTNVWWVTQVIGFWFCTSILLSRCALPCENISNIGLSMD